MENKLPQAFLVTSILGTSLAALLLQRGLRKLSRISGEKGNTVKNENTTGFLHKKKYCKTVIMDFTLKDVLNVYYKCQQKDIIVLGHLEKHL